MMSKRIVGPSPPDPNWDRLDLRGVNSSRHAWGYLSPDDTMIVSDTGRVYILVESSMIEHNVEQKYAKVRLSSKMFRVLQRCLRWSKIVKQMFDFEQNEIEKTTNDEPNLKMKPPKRFED